MLSKSEKKNIYNIISAIFIGNSNLDSLCGITMCIRVSPPKKKFCESWQVIGEVIIKWFYFYYFRFRQLFDWALLKTQNQISFTWSAVNLKNAAENYKKKIRGFFVWKIWKMM